MTAKKTNTRVNNETKIIVIKKENPFRDGTEVAKRADAIFKCNGKTVADLKKLPLGCTAVLRTLVERKLVRVQAGA
jgi:hypothetical protein